MAPGTGKEQAKGRGPSATEDMKNVPNPSRRRRILFVVGITAEFGSINEVKCPILGRRLNSDRDSSWTELKGMQIKRWDRVV